MELEVGYRQQGCRHLEFKIVALPERLNNSSLTVRGTGVRIYPTNLRPTSPELEPCGGPLLDAESILEYDQSLEIDSPSHAQIRWGMHTFGILLRSV